MAPKINYGKILEQRECPGCRYSRPGTKSECAIKMHFVYGRPVSEGMEAWMEKQVFSGACKQRRPK